MSYSIEGYMLDAMVLNEYYLFEIKLDFFCEVLVRIIENILQNCNRVYDISLNFKPYFY